MILGYKPAESRFLRAFGKLHGAEHLDLGLILVYH